MKLQITTIVWGDYYTRLFTDAGLPSLLSAGNIPYLGGRSDVIYKIYTSSKDIPVIKASPSFRRAAENIPFELIPMDHIISSARLAIVSDMRYRILVECERRAYNEAFEMGAYNVLIMPDLVHSDGFFKSMEEILKKGKKCILYISMVNTVEEDFLPALKERYTGSDGLSISISPRDLAGLALEYLHPKTTRSFWESPLFNPYFGCIMWPVKKTGILIRSFVIHPIVVFPVKHSDAMAISVEAGDFLHDMYPDFNDIYVAQDSDEMLAVELCRKDDCCGMPGRKASAFNFASFIGNNEYRDFHSRLPWYGLRFHSEDIDKDWHKAERDSANVIRRVLFYIRSGVFRLRKIIKILSIRLFASRAYVIISCIRRPAGFYRFLSTYYRYTGNNNKSFEFLKKYMDNVPSSHWDKDYLYMSAVKQIQLASYDKAEFIFQRLASLGYRIGDIYCHIGEIYYIFRNDRNQAEKYFRQAAESPGGHLSSEEYLKDLAANKAKNGEAQAIEAERNKKS